MKSIEYIKHLLDKYFEGNTSHSEELELRRFFAEAKDMPAEMSVYKPLFGYIDKESSKIKPMRHHHKLYIRYIWTAAAASILLLFGIAGYSDYIHGNSNYVIINGEKSTNVQLAKEEAQKALTDVGFSQKDISKELIPQDMKEDMQ
jgi:hypothetical protein